MEKNKYQMTRPGYGKNTGGASSSGDGGFRRQAIDTAAQGDWDAESLLFQYAR